MEEDYLTLTQVAQRLHVTVDSVRSWVREKQLPAIKIGRQYLVTPEDLRKFIERRRTDKNED